MLVSTFMAAAEVTVISTAMPTIVGDLGGFGLFTWAFAIYLLGQAITTPIYGRLADLYGRRAVFLGSTALFLAGSLLCGLAWSMPALIAFRAIQGLGGGGLGPLATIILSETSAPQDRARMLSYVSGIWGIAAIVGPLLGSLCVATVGWPAVFWLNLPIGVITSALVLRHMRSQPPEPGGHRLDVAGAALLCAGVGCAMSALIQGAQMPRAVLYGLWVVAALCLGLFGVRERRARAPMLAAHLLRRKLIAAANASALLNGGLVIGCTAFLPPLVQGVLGQSALVAGSLLGLLTVSWTAAAMLLGRLLGRLSTALVALTGAVLVTVGSAGVLLPLGLPGLFAAMVPIGAGLGTGSFVFIVAVTTAAPGPERGRATALFYFSRLIGQAVGAAMLGGVLNAALATGGSAAQPALRALMDPAARAMLPAATLDHLVPVLAAALDHVFVAVLAIAALTLPIPLLIVRAARA